TNSILVSSSDPIHLPPPRAHPLPDTLASWEASEQDDSSLQGDYFQAIAPTALGYLVWPYAPVTIFVEPPPVLDDSQSTETPHETIQVSSNATYAGSRSSIKNSLRDERRSTSVTPISPVVHHQWYDAVLEAIAEWSIYLTLAHTTDADEADIRIWATAPPLQVDFSESGFQLEPARAAETRYEFYIQDQPDATQILLPRYEILIKPGQSAEQIQATARHELGHALGLWGHSPSQTDALYASQVQSPPSISARDIRTLKKVYEQPTQLGWPLPTFDEPNAVSMTARLLSRPSSR
ncbi:MAG: hypothetical protein AAFQ57_09720, partial [Cyanobacteria bacterium J06626_14]